MTSIEKVKEAYKGIDMEEFCWLCDYTPMLNSFGEILIRVDEKGFQGDTFALIKNENKYGYIAFGWGSCPGCDALQGCNNWEDVAKLYDILFNSIHWFNSRSEVFEWFKTHDWEGEWITDIKKEFINEVLKNFEKEEI